MEKVKVNKEIFESLKLVEQRAMDGTLSLVRNKALQVKFESKTLLPLNNLTFEQAIDIYKYGYELEQTPEEKIIKTFKKVENPITEFEAGFREGILFTLDSVDLYIKGINK